MPTIDLPTLFLLSTVLFLLMSVMFFITWHQDRANNGAMLHWAGAHLAGAPACVLLALRGEIPAWASIGAANVFVLLGFGLVLSGALTFEGRRRALPFALGGAVIWLLATRVPAIAESFPHRVILISLMIFAHVASAAVVMWRGQGREPLPSRRFVAGLLGLVAVTHLARMGLTAAVPPSESFAVLGRGWAAFIAVQILLQEVLLGYALLSLVKERAVFRHRRAAEVDSLTGASTRRTFFDRASERLAADPRRGAVLIFDLDRFKSINDTHGHAAGDRVLVEFAAVVRARLGADDVFGRYGGEEFAVFRADADVGAAWRLAEAIRHDFGGLDIRHGGRRITATVSVGVAAVPMIEPDLDRLIASADAGLYLAKRAGRDRVGAGEAEARGTTAAGEVSSLPVRKGA